MVILPLCTYRFLKKGNFYWRWNLTLPNQYTVRLVLGSRMEMAMLCLLNSNKSAIHVINENCNGNGNDGMLIDIRYNKIITKNKKPPKIPSSFLKCP